MLCAQGRALPSCLHTSSNSSNSGGVFSVSGRRSINLDVLPYSVPTLAPTAAAHHHRVSSSSLASSSSSSCVSGISKATWTSLLVHCCPNSTHLPELNSQSRRRAPTASRRGGRVVTQAAAGVASMPGGDSGDSQQQQQQSE